ncbi:hypothetical protein BBJ28_00010292 [Nothophytophthora sp. Chile5]|nr:hypothetical protein BBJ28_00010292 [Nothophytophthora sp. Chile5]
MFFCRCCAATLGNTESPDRASTTPKYPSFHRTCLQYWAGREKETAYTAERIANAGDMIGGTAKLAETNARNMLALHFRRRLHQYIRFRYAPKRVLQLKYKDAKRLGDSCYRCKKAPVLDEYDRPTGKTTSIVLWEWQLRENCSHFLRKLYGMLSWLEMFAAEYPSTRGTKLYSILPVSTSVQAAYVEVNGSMLFGVFDRLLKREGTKESVEEYLRTRLNIVPTEKRTSDSQRPFAKKTFQMHRAEILRKVFDATQFETENRKFADEM